MLNMCAKTSLTTERSTLTTRLPSTSSFAEPIITPSGSSIRSFSIISYIFVLWIFFGWFEFFFFSGMCSIWLINRPLISWRRFVAVDKAKQEKTASATQVLVVMPKWGSLHLLSSAFQIWDITVSLFPTFWFSAKTWVNQTFRNFNFDMGYA